jgi:hypothetical protein
LANPIHIGEIRHKQERYQGQHEAIVPRGLWEEVQQRLRTKAARGRQSTTSAIASPLRERFSMRTASRSMRKGRQRPDAATVTTSRAAWLTVPRARTAKAGASPHRSSSGRWRLPRNRF